MERNWKQAATLAVIYNDTLIEIEPLIAHLKRFVTLGAHSVRLTPYLDQHNVQTGVVIEAYRYVTDRELITQDIERLQRALDKLDDEPKSKQ